MRTSLFEDKEPDEKIHKIYNELKSLFLLQLRNTVRRCNKLCTAIDNQERHVSVSRDNNPAIIKRVALIQKSEKRVRQEIADLEKTSPDPLKRIQFLSQYARGIAELDFSNLFMTIFTGKIRKRWIPVADKYYPVETLSHAKRANTL